VNIIIYLEYFKFKKAPFQITPDDEFLYLSKQHSKAMAYMDYAASQFGGFVIITGMIGAGKTILLKRMMKRLDKKATCISLPFTNLEGKEFFQYVAEEAGIKVSSESKVGLIFSLKKYFFDELNNGRPCVLVIDESQNLSSENLEDLRMLAGLEVADKSLLRVVMLGQPEFIDKVNSFEQLKQRVKLHYHLRGLSEVEVSKYIDYRLWVAGCDNNDIFHADVIKEIYQYSRGIPRLINKICDALLLCAFIEGRKYAVKKDIDEVAGDLMINKPSDSMRGSNDFMAPNKAPNRINEIINNSSSLDRVVYALENINKNLERLANNANKKEEVD
jgi:general secretion pathway protein A